jgi:hypothetical protein
MVDADANAVIRREEATGELSVFSVIPHVGNPSGDPAQVEAVPMGIVFDGHGFLVSTFTGFPFTYRKATIYRVDLSGNVAAYQSGLSSLADIELGGDQRPVVVEYGTWTGEAFAPFSGAVVRSTAGENTPIVSGLNFPNSIERSGLRAYCIAQTFDGEKKKTVF